MQGATWALHNLEEEHFFLAKADLSAHTNAAATFFYYVWCIGYMQGFSKARMFCADMTFKLRHKAFQRFRLDFKKSI